MIGAQRQLVKRLVSREMLGTLWHLGLRIGTLGLRFILSFWIVSILGLEAAGFYGLVVGMIGIVPVAIGWGLNYFCMREVVGMEPARAGVLIVQRLAMTFLSLVVASIASIFALPLMPVPLQESWPLILILLWFETFGVDSYMALIGLNFSAHANLLVFIRSAVWVPVAIIGAWLMPELRTLNTVFILWLGGHVLATILMVRSAMRWPLDQAIAAQPSLAWPLHTMRSSLPIYLSDLGLVGMVFIDRFFVNGFLGIAATGIYSFYWALSNAMQTLITTAVVQPSMPRLISAVRDEDPDAPGSAGAEMRRQILRVAAVSTVLAIGIFVTAEAIVLLSPHGRFPRAEWLFILLLGGSALRCCAELLNLCITSLGRDRLYAATNIGGIALNCLLTPLCLWLFGLNGVGIGAICLAMILTLLRGYYVKSLIFAKNA